MLKIAVVTAYFPSSLAPTDGRFAYQTLKILSRQFDVRVFYPHGGYPSLLKNHKSHAAVFDKTFSVAGVKATYYQYPAVPWLSRPLNGTMAARAVLPHIRRFAPDLIFSFFLYPSGYAALQIAKTLSVPVVAVAVGSDVHRTPGGLSKLYTRKVLREADFLVTVSEDLRLRAVKMGARPASSRTIYSGCDLTVFHPRDRQEARQKLKIDPVAQAIVYVGRIDLRKGLRELVEASALMHSSLPNLHTYLVGDGPDKPAIESLILTRDAGTYVHIVPGCSFNDVALWMAAADLVTLPSYMEGCPNVVLEALACGRPVVATSVGGIPEILNDECGQLIPPRDSNALANAVASVLDKHWASAAIATHWGRGWETCAQEFVEIFETILSGRAGKTKPA